MVGREKHAARSGDVFRADSARPVKNAVKKIYYEKNEESENVTEEFLQMPDLYRF
jgi:hypothetical protein